MSRMCILVSGIDNLKNPSVLQVKRSKTNPFRRGVSLYVGRTGMDLCPVAAMLSYLELRGGKPGPLFVFQTLSETLNTLPFCRRGEGGTQEVRAEWGEVLQSHHTVASESELLPWSHRRAWKIALLKPWAGGRVSRTCSSFVFPKSALWVFLVCWQPRELIWTWVATWLRPFQFNFTFPGSSGSILPKNPPKIWSNHVTCHVVI